MSQLRNLLTNKVIAHKFGTRREFHRQRGYIALANFARLLRNQMAAVNNPPKPQPKHGLLRRVGNFLTRAFKGN
jgi:hypothetical protein